MMVRVQISPAHPLFLRHLSKKRMRMLSDSVGLRRKPFKQREKIAFIALKFRRRSPANFGIALRDGGYTARPWQGKP